MISFITKQNPWKYFWMPFVVFKGIANEYVVDTGRGELSDASW